MGEDLNAVVVPAEGQSGQPGGNRRGFSLEELAGKIEVLGPSVSERNIIMVGSALLPPKPKISVTHGLLSWNPCQAAKHHCHLGSLPKGGQGRE